MTFLRHAARHVHHTVATELEAQLGELDWTTPGSVPFNADKVEVIRTAAINGDELAKDIHSGIVSITLGDEFMPALEEMGGPLSLQEYPLFVDVFQSKDAAALALATDIKDILLGRLEGTKRWLDVVDQVTGNPVVGWKIELDDVERVKPEHVLPLHWQVVKVTAVTYFPEAVY